MAEEFWEDAKNMGYNRYSRENYAIRKLEEKGVKVDRYNIEFDNSGNVDVEAK